MIRIRMRILILILLVCFCSLGIQTQPVQAIQKSGGSGDLILNAFMNTNGKVCVGEKIPIKIYTTIREYGLGRLYQSTVFLTIKVTHGKVDEPMLAYRNVQDGDQYNSKVQYTATDAGQAQVNISGELIDTLPGVKETKRTLVELPSLSIQVIHCKYMIFGYADLTQLNAQVAATGVQANQTLAFRGKFQVNIEARTIRFLAR